MQSKMQIAQVGPTTISPFLPPWENHFSPSKCSSSLTSSAPSNMTTTHQTLTNFVKSGAECKIKVINPLPSHIAKITLTSFIHWNFVQIALKGKKSHHSKPNKDKQSRNSQKRRYIVGVRGLSSNVTFSQMLRTLCKWISGPQFAGCTAQWSPTEGR